MLCFDYMNTVIKTSRTRLPRQLHRVLSLSQKLTDATEDLLEEFGQYTPEFLASLKRAETDIRTGRTREVKSLKELQ